MVETSTLTVLAAGGVTVEAVIDELFRYWRSGGFVMTPLVVGTVVLWFAIGWRWMTLRRGSREELRSWVRSVARGQVEPGGILGEAIERGVALCRSPVDDVRPYLEDAFGEVREKMNGLSALVEAIVAAAPLTGLLGTVTGMIETFDSLGDMALFTQSGGIAGGISVALVSTQMGLAVAIPGLLVGRMLDRRQEKLEAELEELTEMLSAHRARVQQTDPGADAEDDPREAP